MLVLILGWSTNHSGMSQFLEVSYWGDEEMVTYSWLSEASGQDQLAIIDENFETEWKWFWVPTKNHKVIPKACGANFLESKTIPESYTVTLEIKRACHRAEGLSVFFLLSPTFLRTKPTVCPHKTVHHHHHHHHQHQHQHEHLHQHPLHYITG